MSRERRVTIAGLNIVAHPHNPDIYRRLIRAVFRLRKPISVRGEQSLLISHFTISRDDPRSYISGTLARFTNISSELSWFDLHTMEEAEEKELDRINIPEGLRPNFSPFYFLFDPVSHIFVFETRYKNSTISPHTVNKYFTELLNDKRIAEEFGSVKASLISDHAELEKIFSSTHIQEVKILVNRPNPDGLDGFDTRFEERLKAMHAQSAQITYKSTPDQSLKLDKATKAIADLASRNGRVDVKGHDAAGLPVNASTEEIPLLFSKAFQTDAISLIHFTEAAREFISKVKAQIRRDSRG